MCKEQKPLEQRTLLTVRLLPSFHYLVITLMGSFLPVCWLVCYQISYKKIGHFTDMHTVVWNGVLAFPFILTRDKAYGLVYLLPDIQPYEPDTSVPVLNSF